MLSCPPRGAQTAAAAALALFLSPLLYLSQVPDFDFLLVSRLSSSPYPCLSSFNKDVSILYVYVSIIFASSNQHPYHFSCFFLPGSLSFSFRLYLSI
ncbi:hypothetical protein GW17_00028246 [Ensete ventricosum]|nr:hypothetical protein GW17_00028246 [Ensete ventricosum]